MQTAQQGQLLAPSPAPIPSGSQWKTWHNLQEDTEQRQSLVNSIFTLFAQRKPNVNQDWQRKLPDFVKRLEEALYRAARTREEYADQTTLEARLQNVARRMVHRTPNNQAAAQGQGQGVPQSPGGQNSAQRLGSQPGQQPAQPQQQMQQPGQQPGLGQQLGQMPSPGQQQQQQQQQQAQQMQQQQQQAGQQQMQQPGQQQMPQPGLQQPAAPNGGLQNGYSSVHMGGYGPPSSAPMMQRPNSASQQAHPSWGAPSPRLQNGVPQTPSGYLSSPISGGMAPHGGPDMSGAGMVRQMTPSMQQQPGMMQPKMEPGLTPKLEPGGVPQGMAGVPGPMGGMSMSQPMGPGNGQMNGPPGGMAHGSQQMPGQPGMGGPTGPPLNPGGAGMMPTVAQQPLPPPSMAMSMGTPVGGMGGMTMTMGMRGAPSPGSHLMANGVPVLRKHSQAAAQGPWASSQPSPMLNNGMGGQPGGMYMNGMQPGQMPNGGMGAMNGVKMEQQPQHLQQSQQAAQMRQHQQSQMANGHLQNGMIPVGNHSMGPPMPGMIPVGSTMRPTDYSQNSSVPYASGMVPVSSISMYNAAGMPSSRSAGGMNRGMPPIPGGHPGGAPGGMNGGASLASTIGGELLPPGQGQPGGGGGPSGDPEADAALLARKRDYIAKQQRWLLFLRHCAKCQSPEGSCQYGQSCTVAKQLWRHILTCSETQCSYPRCVASRELLKHHQKCSSSSCPVCTPVKQYVQKQRHAINLRTSAAAAGQYGAGGLRPNANVGTSASLQHTHLLNNNMGAGGAQLPSAGVVPLAEPPPKRQKTVSLQENAGTSLLEAFSLEEVRQHMASLALNPQNPSAGGKGKSMFEFADDSVCKACNLNRLTFEPPSLYCTCCGQRIKRNQVFYTTAARASEVKGHWCHGCYSEARDHLNQMDGSQVRKADLQKRKNDEEMDEGWVQCDNCEGWVHQICGLFNKGRNDEDMPYQCPKCLEMGLVNRTRRPIATRPQSMLEARELPRCHLTDHLQSRLDAAVKAERIERAKTQGVPVEAVKAAEGLTVRVVNNVNKVQEVKPQFLDAFKADGFPASLPYCQKVILLFQRIEGVDVCLYCVYTQEYGDECPGPNPRWVYLAYIDSVKYFQPEDVVAAGGGRALRTLVYHELLLGYMEYIKQRGFTSMFIWACPPLQGDDYILYCHPNRQKTPRSDRLREWYHAVLRIGKERGIVTYVSNLFDTFFPGGKDHRLPRVSAAHLPYLEGDYWPGEAENLLVGIAEEARQAGKRASGKGGQGSKGGAVRGKAGAKGKRAAVAGSMDEALVSKLGEIIQGMKDDFMVVHFREPCSFCRKYLSDEPRHYHPNPPPKMVKQERTFEGISLETPGASSRSVLQMSRFQLCGDCHSAAADAATAPASAGPQAKALPSGMALSDLLQDHVEAIPRTHDDGNPHMESEFFDTRQAFLSLCQGNHYQFDTMRRAKHSSMMVLYHLHNPQAPAFACTCNNCGQDVEPGSGYRCSQCSDFDLCANCAMHTPHPHRLVPHARKIDETRQRMSDAERQDRAAQLQRTMGLVVHASACRDPNCASSNCHKIKELYNHAHNCRQKVMGGCMACRRMWALLQLHAKQCSVNDCPVPRCRELRAMRRQQMSRQEDKRRAAYVNMLRNQNAPQQQQ